MNSRWFRDNLSVVVFGAAFVIVLSGAVWFLTQASGQQEIVITQLEEQRAELQRLRNVKPFPSDANIAIVQRDREAVTQLFQEMQEAAVRQPLQLPAVDREIDWSKLLRATVASLNDIAARKAGGKPFKAPELFGFSRYDATFPCKNPAARGEDCKRIIQLLTKQLIVVEKLSLILIHSGVEEITAIYRTEVEPGGANEDVLAEPISQDPRALYQTYPFELQFLCDTHALREVLNQLARAPSLFVVRATRIDAVAATANSATHPSGEVRETALTIPATGTTQLKVSLRVDFVEFAPLTAKKGRS